MTIVVAPIASHVTCRLLLPSLRRHPQLIKHGDKENERLLWMLKKCHTAIHPHPKRRRAPLEPDVCAEFLREATDAHGKGRFDIAIPLYEHVERHNPEELGATYFRALIDIERGAMEAAMKRLQLVRQRNPSSFEAVYALGYTYRELGRWQQSADTFRQAVTLMPESIQAKFNLCHALEVLGKLPEAIALYREMARDESTCISALVRIAQLQPEALTKAEQSALEQALERPDLAPGLRTGLLFAHGELLERQGRYDDAFAAFAEANRRRRAAIIESSGKPRPIVIAPPEARIVADPPALVAARHGQQVALAKRVYTAAFLAAHAGRGHAGRAPIFIVGMPRSGSTLLEQILSSHPKVAGLGEHGTLWQTIAGTFPYGKTDDTTKTELSADYRKLADTYLEKLKVRGWRNTPRVIDKMLGNYILIGMIHLMFPNAIILHSVRNPIDTCLSCFRQLFRTGNETTYDLSDIGAHYVRYREMMDHWRAVLPGRVVDVVHEALVEAPDTMIRWLVEDACRLDWDDACLRFFESRRPVKTASIAQVRQPIFRRSIERWRRYERHLGPLFAALGPYAPAQVNLPGRADADG